MTLLNMKLEQLSAAVRVLKMKLATTCDILDDY
jgi:hypothetical protein